MIERGIEPVGVDGDNPDFQALAQACGCNAVRIDSAQGLTEAVGNAFAADRPTLIEVDESDPWLN